MLAQVHCDRPNVALLPSVALLPEGTVERIVTPRTDARARCSKTRPGPPHDAVAVTGFLCFELLSLLCIDSGRVRPWLLVLAMKLLVSDPDGLGRRRGREVDGRDSARQIHVAGHPDADRPSM